MIKEIQDTVIFQEKMILDNIKNYDYKISHLFLVTPKINLNQITTTPEFIIYPNIDLDKIYYYPTYDQITTKNLFDFDAENM